MTTLALKRARLAQNHAMKQITLKNGLRCYLAPVEGTAATTVLVMVRVGSRYEPEHLNGASHFIEHMMFKGTTNLPTPSDVARSLDAIGADYNAYTSKDYTGYYVKCDGAHQKFAIDTLYDMTFNSLYNQEEMDRERNVIIEEINMYEDTPIRHIDVLLEKSMFPGNSLGWDIAGDAKRMKSMTRDDVMKFRDDHYTPSKMSICVAGRVEDGVEEWLEATFGQIKEGGEANGYQDHVGFEAYDAVPVEMQTKTTDQAHVGIGFPGLKHTDERKSIIRVLSTMLGGNMSSRLFMNVREKGGLAYRVNANTYSFEDTGILSILAGLDKNRIDEAMRRIFEEIDDLRDNGPTEEELKRTKDYLKGKMQLALENSSARAEWYAKQALFHEAPETPEERIAAIDAVTLEDVKKMANEVFDRKKMTMSYIGSESDIEVIRGHLKDVL